MSVQRAGTEVAYTVTWLEMTRRPSYDWPHQPSGPAASLLRAEDPPRWWFDALYGAVGRDYAWEDMPERSDAEWRAWFDPAHMRLYALVARGWPHGFFLLDESGGEDAGGGGAATDLAYFGLVPEAIGGGWGSWLLRTAILTAWEREGMERLTVNTCTLDHPRALAIYQSNGFVPVRRAERTRTLKRDRDLSRIPD